MGQEILDAEAKNAQSSAMIREAVEGSVELYFRVTDYLNKDWKSLKKFPDTFPRDFGKIRGIECQYHFPNEPGESHGLIIGSTHKFRIGGSEVFLSITRFGEKPLQLTINQGGVFFIENGRQQKFVDPTMLHEAFVFAKDAIEKTIPTIDLTRHK